MSRRRRSDPLSRSNPTPPPSSPALSAGPSSLPSAPPAMAGSASPLTPDSPTPPISASPAPGATPVATTAPAAASGERDSETLTPAVQQSDASDSEQKTLLIMDALSQRIPYAEIQQRYSCSPNTIANIAKRMHEIDTGAVAKLMSSKALDAVDLWYESMRNASKQGKHAPMKDWLTHAKVLDPVNGTGESGPRVAVIIGTPGQPIDLPSVQVIDTSVDSSDDGV